jgi:hypothetical protein
MTTHRRSEDGPLVVSRRAAARLKRSVVRRSCAAADAVLGVFRRGDRTIVMCPPAGLRLGNFLYLWLRADLRSSGGHPTVVRAARGMAPWLETIPELRTLTCPADQIRFRDRREWDGAYLYQRFGTDFTREDIGAFVSRRIASHVPAVQTDTIAINVRRGDYYTEFRPKYAFDQVGYIREALTRFDGGERALIVSDDEQWCRANIGPVVEATGRQAQFVTPDPWMNFVAVAGSRWIIGTNSTFSYWAAYVADAIHDDARIVMPLFHGRMAGGTDAHQLDPRWTAIDGFH